MEAAKGLGIIAALLWMLEVMICTSSYINNPYVPMPADDKMWAQIVSAAAIVATVLTIIILVIAFVRAVRDTRPRNR